MLTVVIFPIMSLGVAILGANLMMHLYWTKHALVHVQYTMYNVQYTTSSSNWNISLINQKPEGNTF